MKVSTKRILSILSSTILLVGSLVALTYLIQPAYSNIMDTRAQIVSKTKIRDTYDSSIKQAEKIKADYQNLLDTQQSISSILPPQEDLPETVNQVSGLAALNNLDLQTLSLTKPEVKSSSNTTDKKDFIKAIGTMKTSFKIVGSYESFRNFIGQLENNSDLLDLESLKITPFIDTVSKTQVQDKYTYDLEVDNYYQAE